MDSISTVIVGCGKRAKDTYIPILRKMKTFVRLIAVCSMSELSAREVGENEKVPYYTSLERMIENEKFDLAIVSVSRNSHLEPAIKLINAGINILIETPLAESLEDIDAIINSAKGKNIKIEVAENYYRKPRVQIILKLIENNIFGRINVVYSNFAGHGYHGMSLLRSYLGFNLKPVKVTGFSKTYPVINHIWRHGQPPRNTENWELGLIEFENGSSGVYSFSSLSYRSPLRRETSKNSISFYAEKGMGDGLDLMIIEGNDKRLHIPIERRVIVKEGIEILDAFVAKAKEEIAWTNPLIDYNMEEEKLGVALCLLEIINAIRENREPEYGVLNARRDRALEIALEKSWSENNKTIIFTDFI